MKDIRVLCSSCLSEYREAGYRVYLIWTEKKESCDKCRIRMGWTYEIKQMNRRNK